MNVSQAHVFDARRLLMLKYFGIDEHPNALSQWESIPQSHASRAQRFYYIITLVNSSYCKTTRNKMGGVLSKFQIWFLVINMHIVFINYHIFCVYKLTYVSLTYPTRRDVDTSLI